MDNIIIKIEKNSIAEELGVEAGDILLSINETQINDVFDYRYLMNDEYIEVAIMKSCGEEWLLEVEKEYNEDLGIVFESGLMDKAKSCKNKCIFCFIDQLPEGMRDTLYFKDDDSRLSFLQGNYVTLTNMKEEDLDRIIYYHLSPINVSVHTTDMDLRHQMLKNPNSRKLMDYIQKIADSGIELNFQVVLCKGINDGEYLTKTIKDLAKFYPKSKSLSIVPVGISKYREGLHNMEPFEEEDCKKVIKQVTDLQEELLEKHGSRFVYLSDEFYLVGNVDIPETKAYEDFPQIENGVGMTRSFNTEIFEAMDKYDVDLQGKELSIVTGTLAEPNIKYLCDILGKKFNAKINVYAIKNDFFGEYITVVGLLTGQDIEKQLKDKSLGEFIMLSKDTFKSDEDIFLDDMTAEELENSLNTKIRTNTDGFSFVKNIIEV